jgi:nucleotide-binding universal stress UspA family protein
MSKPIVVGFDGTDGGHAALDQAITFASQLGAPLTIVFGYAPPKIEREAKDYLDALKEIGERVTGEAVTAAKEKGVEATPVLKGEPAVDALVTTADEVDAQMIVVGSNGERPLTGAILGSVPHKLLHLTDRPVLVVRK